MVSVHYQGRQLVVVPPQSFIEDDPAKQNVYVLVIKYLPTTQTYMQTPHKLGTVVGDTSFVSTTRNACHHKNGC